MNSLKYILIPSSFFAFMRLILGVFSILALVRYSTDYGFSPILDIAVRRFETALAYVLSPLDPIVVSAANWIASFLKIEFNVYPHWRYILVLMNAFLFSRVAVTFQAGQFFTTFYRIVIALLSSFAASIAVGLQNPVDADYFSNFQIAVYPLIALFIYHFANAVWMVMLGHGIVVGGKRIVDRWLAFVHRMKQNVKYTVVGIIFFLVGLTMPAVNALPSPGLILVAIYMIGASISYLWVARQEAKIIELNTLPGAGDRPPYWRTNNAIVGAGILNIFIWTLITVLIDVGYAIGSF